MNPRNITQNPTHHLQSGNFIRPEINLGDIACHHHFRVEAEPGEKHLHLFGCGVLRLVQNHESIIEGASAHIGQRRHLNGAGSHEFRNGIGIEHVVHGIV